MSKNEDLKKWIKGYFSSFDSREDSYYEYFDSNVLFQGGVESAIGLDNLKPAFESVRQNHSFSTHHEPLQIIISDEDLNADYVACVELRIDYKFSNGNELSLPCATIINIKDSKITAHKGFMDTAPLFKALSEL